MRIQDLEAFLAVNKFGSLSAAAQNLYITQPTLSNQIKSLENELNVQLIYRNRGVRSTSLTPAGQALVPQAEKLIALISETKSLVGTAQAAKIHFTCVQSTLPLVAPPINAFFQDISAECSLDITAMSSEHVYQHIANKEIDIALCCSPPPEHIKNIKADYLFSEPLVFTCLAESPYPSAVRVHDLRLKDQILIHWHKSYMMWQEQWFGSVHSPYLCLRNSTIIPEFFHNKATWAILPVSIASRMGSAFRICRLDHMPPERPFYLASNYPEPEPYFSEIKQIILDTFKEYAQK